MRPHLRATLTCIVVLMIAGCGTHISTMRLNKAPHTMKPKRASDVAVFMSKKPKRAYVEVAMLEARRRSVYSTDDAQAVMRNLRVAAARRGCDAIVMSGSANETVGAGGGYRAGGGYVATLKGYRAVCIVYK